MMRRNTPAVGLAIALAVLGISACGSSKHATTVAAQKTPSAPLDGYSCPVRPASQLPNVPPKLYAVFQTMCAQELKQRAGNNPHPPPSMPLTTAQPNGTPIPVEQSGTLYTTDHQPPNLPGPANEVIVQQFYQTSVWSGPVGNANNDVDVGGTITGNSPTDVGEILQIADPTYVGQPNRLEAVVHNASMPGPWSVTSVLPGNQLIITNPAGGQATYDPMTQQFTGGS